MSAIRNFISRLFGASPRDAADSAAAVGPGGIAEVIEFPGAAERSGIDPAFGPVSPQRPAGLLDHRLLNAFFDERHFGLGVHNGAHYRSVEALQRGRDALVQRFVTVLETIIEQKTSELYRLEDQQLLTKGVNNTIGSRLDLAQRRLEREIERLREQQSLASDGKGWVLRAVNEYRMGFNKGLEEALTFDGLLQGESS